MPQTRPRWQAPPPRECPEIRHRLSTAPCLIGRSRQGRLPKWWLVWVRLSLMRTEPGADRGPSRQSRAKRSKPISWRVFHNYLPYISRLSYCTTQAKFEVPIAECSFLFLGFLEEDLSFDHRGFYRVAFLEGASQHLVGERILYQPLDRASQGSRAEFGIISFF